MSGIPGMGQRWRSALKIWVIMIPLSDNPAAGAASGVCCSGIGGCKVSGSLAGRSKHIPSHTGGEKMKNHAGDVLYVYVYAALSPAWRVGLIHGESKI